MPELPEVETTRRGIAPHLEGREVRAVVVRQPRLRRRISPRLARELPGLRITGVDRRAKYLLIHTAAGTLLLHLGMSGSLRVVEADTPATAHDHLDFLLDDGRALRFRDPRRFGTVAWTHRPPLQHPLLRHLGPEPLAERFDGAYLHARAQKRRIAVKPFIMDSRIVVGVGNIYASEALFRARIDPRRPAGKISRERYARLALAIKETLQAAIEQGGTTLRDYLDEKGEPGYFTLHLNVYGREGEPCPACRRPIRSQRLGQRSTFFCPHCQR